MSEKLLLKFANTEIGRAYFGVPKKKLVVKITDYAVHFYTGEFSKTNGLPVICAQGSPAGAAMKRALRLLKFYPSIIEMAFLGLVHPLILLMADTGFKFPSAHGGYFNEWINPANAYADDGVYASVYLDQDPDTSKMQTYRNFSFGIPISAVIDGIEVRVEGRNDPGLTGNLGVYFYCYSPEKESEWRYTPNLTTSDVVYTLGGSSEKWGVVWAASDFNDGNFLLQLGSTVGSSKKYQWVDYIQVKIYYTEVQGRHRFFIMF